jgi:predicted methyltransferase
MIVLARAATLIAAAIATCASGADIGFFLAPPGVPTTQFPVPRRPVAPIVSPSRSAEESRDALDEDGEIARVLEIKPGMTVADIGAGSGYHTVRLSPRVGPTGTVIAEDVTKDYLVELARCIEELKLANIKLVLGEPHDPRLPFSSLDAAILVHMYHEIEQPHALLHNRVPMLKPGARVGIVDQERPTSEHGTPIELLRCELAAVGCRTIATYLLAGDGGYLAVFSPPDAASRKSPKEIVPCDDRAGTR